MHIAEIFSRPGSTRSFEFFPPKTPAGAEKLLETLKELERLEPSFVSVTYGAGGSTRDLTHNLVLRIAKTTQLPAIPHLTCVGHQRNELAAIVERYAAAGISNILALGGDPPVGNVDYDRSRDGFRYAADLVAFIRGYGLRGEHPHPEGFGIGVAGYPEGHPATPNRLLEMDHLKAKVDAGAHYICTQLFFDNRDFFDFRDRCTLAGIHVPIVAGIMPITSITGMRRMASLAAGARIPAPLLKQVLAVQDDPAAVEAVGIEWSSRQCQELLNQGVAGLHFYTLNQSRATLTIARHLG